MSICPMTKGDPGWEKKHAQEGGETSAENRELAPVHESNRSVRDHSEVRRTLRSAARPILAVRRQLQRIVRRPFCYAPHVACHIDLMRNSELTKAAVVSELPQGAVEQ